VIQKRLTDKIALELLEGHVREGDTVTVDARDGELVIEPVAGAASEAAPVAA